MLVQNVILGFALSSLGLAQDVDNDDIPVQCTAVCSAVVALSRTCDAQNNDNDPAYLNCVCNTVNANSIIPLCEACVSQFDSDRSDNDVNDLVRSCSFTTTSFNPSATAASASLVTGTGSLRSLATATGSITSAPTGSAAPSQNPSTPTTGTIVQQSPGAAAALGAPAGAVLGVFGVILGMM
ncbi:hypothetical protein B0J11DRAFT_106087 [Dendryphion nanum]|uniref:Gpi anchored protein n=1 Tax=Dendryphion nanum TaxID=256645 RepID=A0A9P9DD75_9PLEO|nr:hypothetical protein B0J11DRAFT_106087 [Dendryphion nanum]